MKKASSKTKDELRPEYRRSDFGESFVRGKYADRIRKSSNVVVLRPEVAEAFPDSESVNAALMSLIDLARSSTRRKATRPRRASATKEKQKRA